MAVPHDPATNRAGDAFGGTGCRQPDQARLLARLDELTDRRAAAVREHAAACPACGPRLRLLDEAEAWLAARRPEALLEPGPCPAAEQLYDFGRGPGARPLAVRERGALETHVERCGECAALVATLAARPPVPLVLGEPDELEEDAEPPTRSPAETRDAPQPLRALPPARKRGHWIPLVAAAALLATLGLFWNRIFASGPGAESVDGLEIASAIATAIAYPAAPLLRGDAAPALAFPRERVLAGTDAGLLFEIVPQPRAQLYRVHLMRTDGGAFDPGRPVAMLESAEPRLALEDAGTERAALTEGHFTWEAWAVVDGLDTPLGRRDFEIVRDAEAQSALRAFTDARAAGRLSGERASTLLALLHARGLLTDSRAVARTLPASPERERFLRDVPAR